VGNKNKMSYKHY